MEEIEIWKPLLILAFVEEVRKFRFCFFFFKHDHCSVCFRWKSHQSLLLLSRFTCVKSVRPHRRQPTRLCSLWDSPGKNTGVGCYFLLQCMKVKSESEIAQLCPTLSDPMDCSLPGSSMHGILQARGTGVGCHCLLHISH